MANVLNSRNKSDMQEMTPFTQSVISCQISGEGEWYDMSSEETDVTLN